MTLQPLATNEVASNGGFTHLAVITANDLTDSTNDETQTITICNLRTGDRIGHGYTYLKTAFQDASRATPSDYNSLTMSIGDEDAVDTHMAAKEICLYGTEITGFSWTTTIAAAADPDVFKAVFTPDSGKALLEVDTGEVHIYFQLIRVVELVDAKAGLAMTK